MNVSFDNFIKNTVLIKNVEIITPNEKLLKIELGINIFV